MVRRRFIHWSCTLASVLLCLVAHVRPAGAGSMFADERARAGHVLNRIAYGPAPADLAHAEEIGLAVYIGAQLAPDQIDESDNVTLHEKEDALFEWQVPSRETTLIAAGVLWHYYRGMDEPETSWNRVDFDDSSWPLGLTGIGYGDGDDATVLDDMRRTDTQTGYLSVYLRREFQLTADSWAAISDLLLRVDYDDGFKAYLNGTEVARANLPSGEIAHDVTATASHEAGSPEDLDISVHKDLLKTGRNVLAIQVHNRSATSSDLSMIPALISREILPGPARRTIRGIDGLQRLVHVRGIYSRKQLQAVLAEFWENHFTTDADKLVDYLDNLQNSDATDAMSREQARAEAAQLEYQEYQFFYENALGNFGDLLLYSATSSSMLVYLDNVLNVKGKANENYAREILELHTFGGDNRYTQRDIEQLARCFTGWTTAKVAPEHEPSFPDSALNPPLQSGVQFADTVILDLGTNWRYFKGTEEPAPAAGGAPATAWAAVGFDDTGWLNGPTGIGYGDNDDATVLGDMRDGYVSVYLRHAFTVTDPAEFKNLILEVAYDDGFVACLNGVEVARSASMRETGSPPAYDQVARDGHEVDAGPEYFNLSRFATLLEPGPNVLAIQVHNRSLGSSDLSILPRLIDRAILPGSVENSDRNAVWTFNFRPDQHDTGEKVLFEGTPYEMVIPAGRTGREGLADALDVVRSLVNHPSTAEFIGIKLIQKFVSDEITLATYRDGTAPEDVRQLLDEVIAAWHSTEPAGNIAVVMETLLDPVEQSNLFWSERAYRSKVKTAIEYVNSSLRVLEASVDGSSLPELNDAMGMDLFTRDDPDGYSELGSDWIDTASMLARIEFVNELATNRNANYQWDTERFLAAWDLQTPDEIIDAFDDLLFQGTLSNSTRDLLLRHLTTDEDGSPSPLDPTNAADYRRRIQELVGLMLSVPQWQFQ